MLTLFCGGDEEEEEEEKSFQLMNFVSFSKKNIISWSYNALFVPPNLLYTH
jgi:hypothetical protein